MRFWFKSSLISPAWVLKLPFPAHVALETRGHRLLFPFLAKMFLVSFPWNTMTKECIKSRLKNPYIDIHNFPDNVLRRMKFNQACICNKAGWVFQGRKLADMLKEAIHPVCSLDLKRGFYHCEAFSGWFLFPSWSGLRHNMVSGKGKLFHFSISRSDPKHIDKVMENSEIFPQVNTKTLL